MIIGLTGPIGSGKSFVACELAKAGAYIIDLDVIARELVEPGMAALKEIQDRFGQEYILENGTLNRRALGKLVFSDPEALSLLNKIMFPRLIESTKEKLTKSRKKHKLIVIDAAVLYQTGLDKFVDKVIIVIADEKIRISRIMKRDGLSYEEALIRVAGQNDFAKIQRFGADLVLDNSSTLTSLSKKLIDGLCHLGIDKYISQDIIN